MPDPYASPIAVPAPDPRLEQVVQGAMLLAVALVMLLPGARAYSPLLGWVPLWLLGMPAVAWWSLYRFRLAVSAGLHDAPAGPRRSSRRRAPAQAATRLRPRGACPTPPDLRQGGAKAGCASVAGSKSS